MVYLRFIAVLGVLLISAEGYTDNPPFRKQQVGYPDLDNTCQNK